MRAAAAFLAFLQAANFAVCCCGLYCPRPNAVCFDCPLRAASLEPGGC